MDGDARSVFSRHWHWLLLVGLIAYFGLETLLMGGRLIFVPRERDARIIGRWTGVNKFGDHSRKESIEFLGNGTLVVNSGPSTGPRRSVWGTKDGKLHLKWLETDAWVGKAYPYDFIEGGRVLRLAQPKRTHFIPALLHRPRGPQN